MKEQPCWQELEQLEKTIKTCQKENKPVSTALCLQVLQLVREYALRKPNLIVYCGEHIMKSNGTSDPEVFDQVLRAALDVHHYELADACLDHLQKHFANSVRVAKLEALVFEAKGDIENALAIYEGLLEKNPTDAYIYKRKVALYKAHGSTEKAITYMNKYLRVFQADADAYAELADMYLSVLEYKKAAFCLEECLLFQPQNPLLVQRYADLAYTMNDVALARKYYAYGLNLWEQQQQQQEADATTTNTTILRCLFGLNLCLQQQQQDKTLQTHVQEQITKLMQKRAPPALWQALQQVIQ